jgi:hypothetical protein
VSHLLVGAERRTLKLLLGVANGAWLLQPEWLTTSLEQVGIVCAPTVFGRDRPTKLACSAYDSSVNQLGGGFRVRVDGHEEGRVSHLLVGAERRTLKLLLGVANGAWLLQPEWLTTSLEQVGLGVISLGCNQYGHWPSTACL